MAKNPELLNRVLSTSIRAIERTYRKKAKVMGSGAKHKWLSPDNLILVALGDSGKIRDQLEKAMGPVDSVKVLPADSDWGVVSAASSQ